MKIPFLPISMAIAAILSPPAQALEGDPYADEAPAARDSRMAWWRDAKFGMFIHWGVYAVPAGVYEGEEIKGIGEWIMLRAKIPVDTYKSYAKDFNPVKYDPTAWAALAKEAGMRYMVITAKHHDGFALFPTEASDWDIIDATPWKKDLIAPLAKAARDEDLKFGLYYSQAQDWNHPGGAKAGFKEGEGWDDAQKGSFDTYIDEIAVPQVREILTRYQPDVLWWDTPHLMTPERGAKLAALLQLRPGIIHNNRLGGGYKGDTETPEQHIPATGFPGRDWETCMTMNDTWGFKSGDQNWKSFPKLIHNLVDIVSKGGNYLLNIGPTAEGGIPPQSVDLLKQVGAWMKVNGESIYGTTASPFKHLDWGRCTVKADGQNTILYLHILTWPENGTLLVPGLTNEVLSTRFLAGGGSPSVTATPRGPVLTLPAAAPDAVCSTVKMVVKGKPNLARIAIPPGEDGVLRLLPGNAKLSGGTIRNEGHGETENIGFWSNPKDTVSWKIHSDKGGKYLIRIEASAPSAGSVILIRGVGRMACSLPQTENYATYQTTKVGVVELKKDSDFTLTLRPVPDAWKPVNVRKVELIPQP